MSAGAAAKRAHAVAKRAAKLRREGLSLGQIAEATGIDRQKVADRIELGERLLQVGGDA